MMLLEILREDLLKCGMATFKELGRLFGKYDGDGDKMLSPEEFIKGLGEYGVNVEQSKQLFAEMDADGNGFISATEFFLALNGSDYANNRKEIVEAVFKKIDTNNEGMITIANIRTAYNVDGSIRNEGEQTEEEIQARRSSRFLQDLDPKKNIESKGLSFDEFLDYYAAVSAGIETDAEFEEFIKKEWNV